MFPPSVDYYGLFIAFEQLSSPVDNDSIQMYFIVKLWEPQIKFTNITLPVCLLSIFKSETFL